MKYKNLALALILFILSILTLSLMPSLVFIGSKNWENLDLEVYLLKLILNTIKYLTISIMLFIIGIKLMK